MAANQQKERHFAPQMAGQNKLHLSVNNTMQKVQPVIKEDFDRRFLDQMRMLMLEIRTNSPFFGILGTDIWIAGASDAVPTIGVSPKGVVVYNEKWLKSKTAGNIVALLVHEAMHPALDFWDRFKGLHFERSNWAHDFVINAAIEDGLCSLVLRRANGDKIPLKIELPEGMLYDPAYKNMSGTEVYQILTDKINARAEEIKAQMLAQMSDPAQRAEMERQRKIAQQMRQSVAEGGKLIGEKTREAIHKTNNASYEVAGGHKSMRDLHQDLLNGATLEFTHKDGTGTDRKANNPFGDKQQPQQANKPDSNPQPGLPQQGEAANEGDDSLGHKDPAGQQGEPKRSPFDQAKDQLDKDLHEAFRDYINKEQDRISNEVDGNPDGSTRKENLESLKNDIDERIEEFIDKATNPDQAQPEDSPQQQGNDSCEPGDPSEGQGQPQAGQSGGEPSQSAGQESSGAGGQPVPGNEQGQAGQGAPGGQSQPGQGTPDGQSQMGGAQGSSSGAGEPGAQPGSSQGAGQGSPTSEPVSPHQARSAAQKALENMADQLGKTLTGKDGGMPGLDRQMASGDDMVGEGAMKQAMDELRKELGQDGENSMTGDVLIDCDNIPGNPFKDETPEQTNERRKSTLQRAVIEQSKSAQGMGNMPAWLKTEFEGILHPPLKFTDKMKRYIGQYGRADQRSYSLPNRRNSFVKDTMIKPGVRKNSAKVYIMRDVSYSMMNPADLDSLRRSIGLVDRLANAQRLEVEVVLVDAEVTKVMNTREALREVEQRAFEVVGQGGSNLTPAFERIWKEMSTVNAGRGNPIIVFTDGEIGVPDMPPKNIRQQVLWITNPGQRPPTTKWGEHVVMDDL